MDMQKLNFKKLPMEIQMNCKEHVMVTEYLMWTKAQTNETFAQQMMQFPNFPVFFDPGDPSDVNPIGPIEQRMTGAMGAMGGPMAPPTDNMPEPAGIPAPITPEPTSTQGE
jgi:hypothetical protein